MPSRKRLAALSLFVVCSTTLTAQPGRSSAWEALVRRDPAAVGDESITWRERLILHALTAEQAELYFAGRADAASLRLEDGRTLAEYLESRLSPPAQVFIPLAVPCRLFSLTLDGEHTEARSISARSANLGVQRGAPDGCGIAEEASAILLRAAVHPLGGLPARLKLWAADGPEPADGPEREEAALNWPLSYEATLLAPLCGGCPEGEIALRAGGAARVSAEALGYFRPMAARDAPEGGIRFSTEGSSNNFFGVGAGASNTAGVGNSFFGASSGASNTAGESNAFFGAFAGFSNTTGFNNSAFGEESGTSNTTESGNTFIGSFSNGVAGVTNATALGYTAQVSQSNSLVLGSIAGVNFAIANVKVGIGTTAPQKALHVKRDDGSAKILVEEAAATSAIRQIFEMKNTGGVGFQMTDSRTDAEAWQFQTNQSGNFSINNVADASGGTEFFLLKDTGDVLIEGEVTAQAFTPVSDRTLKENFRAADPEEVLEKVARLPISLWNFKADEPQVRHIGPMAQDFFAAFGLGGSDRTINLLDASGVALAAIQGLGLENVRLRGQVSKQQVEIDSLKREMAELRALVESAARR